MHAFTRIHKVTEETDHSIPRLGYRRREIISSRRHGTLQVNRDRQTDREREIGECTHDAVSDDGARCMPVTGKQSERMTRVDDQCLLVGHSAQIVHHQPELHRQTHTLTIRTRYLQSTRAGSSAVAEGPRDALFQSKSCRKHIRNVPFEKGCNRGMTIKYTVQYIHAIAILQLKNCTRPAIEVRPTVYTAQPRPQALDSVSAAPRRTPRRAKMQQMTL